MRNLLALFAAAVLTFAGVGWYLGWYRVSPAPAAEGHRSFHIDVDGTKMGQDLQKGKVKIEEALDRTQDNASLDVGPGAAGKDNSKDEPSPQTPVRVRGGID
jgi:hypothetical protein